MTHLFTDADNTLWDTNAVFVEAQLGLLRALEQSTGLAAPQSHDLGLAFLRAIDQRLARLHPDHLRYPPQLLVKGLLAALRGATPEQAVAAAFSGEIGSDHVETIQTYLNAINKVPALRSGVRVTLARAQELGIPVTVVTEEKADRSSARLAAHHLTDFVRHVVSAPKDVRLFRSLRGRKKITRCIMVGDQPDRDITPAERAGFECYLYPSDFTPFWTKSSKVQTKQVLSSFDQLLPILET